MPHAVHRVMSTPVPRYHTRSVSSSQTSQYTPQSVQSPHLAWQHPSIRKLASHQSLQETQRRLIGNSVAFLVVFWIMSRNTSYEQWLVTLESVPRLRFVIVLFSYGLLLLFLVNALVDVYRFIRTRWSSRWFSLSDRQRQLLGLLPASTLPVPSTPRSLAPTTVTSTSPAPSPAPSPPLPSSSSTTSPRPRRLFSTARAAIATPRQLADYLEKNPLLLSSPSASSSLQELPSVSSTATRLPGHSPLIASPAPSAAHLFLLSSSARKYQQALFSPSSDAAAPFPPSPGGSTLSPSERSVLRSLASDDVISALGLSDMDAPVAFLRSWLRDRLVLLVKRIDQLNDALNRRGWPALQLLDSDASSATDTLLSIQSLPDTLPSNSLFSRLLPGSNASPPPTTLYDALLHHPKDPLVMERLALERYVALMTERRALHVSTCPPRGYILSRLRQLAQGHALSAYAWQQGGSWQGKSWTQWRSELGQAMPTDAALVLHCFSTLLDEQLPTGLRAGSHVVQQLLLARPFTAVYCVSSTANKLSTEGALDQMVRAPLKLAWAQEMPPHLHLVMNGHQVWEIQEGRHNVFCAIAVFLWFVRTEYAGYLDGVDLFGKSLMLGGLFASSE